MPVETRSRKRALRQSDNIPRPVVDGSKSKAQDLRATRKPARAIRNLSRRPSATSESAPENVHLRACRSVTANDENIDQTGNQNANDRGDRLLQAPRPRKRSKSDRPGQRLLRPSRHESKGPLNDLGRGRRSVSTSPMRVEAEEPSCSGRHRSDLTTEPAQRLRLSTLPCIDTLMDTKDILQCTDYVDEMILRNREIERGLRKTFDGKYLWRQARLTLEDRALAVNTIAWLFHDKGMATEVQFNAVLILDRYLTAGKVQVADLFQVAAACILLACKMEHSWTLDAYEVLEWLSGLQHAEHHELCEEGIRQQELTILKALRWHMGWPTVASFFRRYLKAVQAPIGGTVYYISRYLLELSTMSYHLVCWLASDVAAAAVYLAQRCVGISPCLAFPAPLQMRCGSTLEELWPAVMLLVDVHDAAAEPDRSSFPGAEMLYDFVQWYSGPGAHMASRRNHRPVLKNDLHWYRKGDEENSVMDEDVP